MSKIHRFLSLLHIVLIIAGAQLGYAAVMLPGSYAVQSGDYNNDGNTDLLLRAKAPIIPISFRTVDIFLPYASGYSNYLLLNQGDGSYQFVVDPSQSQIELVSWSSSGYLKHFGDFNGDGLADLFLQGEDIGDTNFVLLSESDKDLALSQQINNDQIVSSIASIMFIDNSQDGRDDLVINSVQVVLANAQGAFAGINGGWLDHSSTLVATTSGAGGVTKQGAAGYEFEIALPGESIPLKPNLSIGYHSRGGSGLLGMGWNLKGLSSIERCRPTRAQDGSSYADPFSDNERFCIDGQKLIAISGVYGEAGTEYRTEMDQMMRVVSIGVAGEGPAGFKVWTKNGLVLEYGLMPNSQFLAPGRADVQTWGLNKASDLFGNFYTVTYNDRSQQNNRQGEFYPTQMEYGASVNGLGALYSVVFSYQSRPDGTMGSRADQVWGYRVGSQFRTTQLLDKITVYHIGGVQSQPVREFDLDYEQSPLTGKMRLVALDQCGWDKSGLSQSCAKTTSMDWYEGNELFEQPVPINGVTAQKTSNRPPLILDVNNDGYKDLAWCGAQAPGLTWFFRLGSESGFSTQEISTGFLSLTAEWGSHSPCSPWLWHASRPLKITPQKTGIMMPYELPTTPSGGKTLHWGLITWDEVGIQTQPPTPSVEVRRLLQSSGLTAATGDINADGMGDDFVHYRSSALDIVASRIDLYPSDPHQSKRNWTVGQYADLWPQRMMLFDLDGDGYQDILINNVEISYGPKGWYLIRSGNFEDISDPSSYTPGDFFPIDGLNLVLPDYTSTHMPEITPLPFGDGTFGNGYILDLNNDGLGDFVTKVNGSWKLYVNEGGVWSSEIDTGEQSGEPAGSAIPMDFDGDGTMDLLVKHPTGSNWRILLSEQIVNAQGDIQPTFRPIDTSIVADGYFPDPMPQDLINEYLPLDVKPLVVDADNDGLSDIIYLDQSTGQWMLMKRSSNHADLLLSVTDGFGVKTEFSYQSLNDDTVYTHDNVATWPTQPTRMGIKVVRQMKESDGVGGDRITTYTYSGAKIDLRGRGFLGFASRTVTDQQTGIVVTESYHQQFPYIGKAISSTITSGATTLSKTTNTWGNRLLNSDTNTLVTLDKVVKEKFDLDSGLAVGATEVVNSYDDYGTLTSSDVVTGSSWDGTAIVNPVSTVNAVNTPDNDIGNWLLGFVTDRTVTFTRPGEAPKVIVSSYIQEPGTLGIQEQTDFVGTNVERTTKTFWDTYGNINRQEVTGTNVPVGKERVSTQLRSASSDGRHPDQVGNALFSNQVQYDVRFGFPRQLVDPNNYVSEVEYDVFGRVIKETNNDGVETNYLHNYCANSSCPTDITPLYRITTLSFHTSTPNIYVQPRQVAYYDMLGREIRREVQGFMGDSIYVDTIYDALGRIDKVSEPYRANGQKYWTDIDYDVLGREILRTKPDTTTIETDYEASPTFATMVTKTVEIVTPNGSGPDQVTTQHFNELGELVESVNANLVSTRYRYNAQGNLRWTQVNGDSSTIIDVEHDVAGNRTSIDDPSAGLTQSVFDGLGQLISETNGNNEQTTLGYDALGRMTSRDRGSDGLTTWEYDSIGGAVSETEVGQLIRVTTTGYEELLQYNGEGRVQYHTTTVTGKAPYLFSFSYDSLGRLDTTYSPSNFGYRQHYNAYGYKESIEDVTSGNGILWSALESNERGKIILVEFGNGLGTQRGYNPQTGVLESIATGALSAGNSLADQSIQDLVYTHDNIGNVYSRSSDRGAQYLTESFTYDQLNRLRTADTTGLTQSLRSISYDYDELGNITTKSDVGSYKYAGACSGGGFGPHAVCEVSGAVSATYAYDNAGNMTSNGIRTIGYNRFNKPTSITEGSTLTEFAYAANDELYYQRVTGNGNTRETFSIAGGAYEEVIDANAGVNKRKTYIEGIAVYIESDDGVSSLTPEIQYLHTDHLGSTESLTDGSGNLMSRMAFDPFGLRRDDGWEDMSASDWLAVQATTLDTTANGYTGHDQVDQHKLIHMGGRVYDPVVGRFMSADPFIQAPGNSQSFNRYSYVMNNPLANFDPSGYSSCPMPPEDATIILPCPDNSIPAPGIEISMPGFPEIDPNVIISFGDFIKFKGGAPSQLSTEMIWGEFYMENSAPPVRLFAGAQLGAAQNYNNSVTGMYAGMISGMYSGMVAADRVAYANHYSAQKQDSWFSGDGKDDSDLRWSVGLQGGFKLGAKGIFGASLEIKPPVIESSLITGNRYASEGYGFVIDVGKWSFGYDVSRSLQVGEYDIMAGQLLQGTAFDGGFKFGSYGVDSSQFGVFSAGFTLGGSINATFDFVDGTK